MKKLVTATALSLALAVSASVVHAEENIAVINSGYLIQNHPANEAARQRLEALAKEPSQKLQAERKAIENKMAALQKEAPKLRSADIKKREEEIQKLGEAFDKKYAEFQAKMEQAQMEEQGKIIESIQAATNSVAEKHNYTYVVDINSIIYAAKGKNITEEVFNSIVKTEPKKEDAPKADAKPAKK